MLAAASVPVRTTAAILVHSSTLVSREHCSGVTVQ